MSDAVIATAKVLGIGLSRTGTLSLRQALEQLGYRAAHYVDHREALRGESTWFAGDFETDSLIGFDAAVDLPVPAFYPQLDTRYPGSRFILTVRDAESWIASVRRHWSRKPITDDAQGRYRRWVRLATYGTFGFSEARMRFVYETHVRNVMDFFAGRPRDLLVLDICGGQGWDRLCPFLDKPPPCGPFPWLHRG